MLNGMLNGMLKLLRPLMIGRIVVGLAAVGLAVVGLSSCGQWIDLTETTVDGSDAPLPPAQPSYEVQTTGATRLHILRIPPGSALVEVAVADGVQALDRFADDQKILAVINAGFFDPTNGESTSHGTVAGKVTANPEDNRRLVENPKLKAYLPAMFDRSEFRRYDCGGLVQYAIVRHSEGLPNHCRLVDAMGAGPQLLPKLSATEEAFWDETTGRDPIGLGQNNARSAIGLTPTGEVILVMVEQVRSGGGLALRPLAAKLRDLGATSALNLDGGTSSALYYQTKTTLGKRDAQNRPISRPVKSVLRLRKLAG